jgi:hypothetical protein
MKVFQDSVRDLQYSAYAALPIDIGPPLTHFAVLPVVRRSTISPAAPAWRLPAVFLGVVGSV